jgi:hypothetical protein
MHHRSTRYLVASRPSRRRRHSPRRADRLLARHHAANPGSHVRHLPTNRRHHHTRVGRREQCERPRPRPPRIGRAHRNSLGLTAISWPDATGLVLLWIVATRALITGTAEVATPSASATKQKAGSCWPPGGVLSILFGAPIAALASRSRPHPRLHHRTPRRLLRRRPSQPRLQDAPPTPGSRPDTPRDPAQCRPHAPDHDHPPGGHHVRPDHAPAGPDHSAGFPGW